MRAFRNILLSATAFIAVLAVVALTADLGVLRPLYEQIGSHLLKREVRILGPLEVRLGRHLEVSCSRPHYFRSPTKWRSVAQRGSRLPSTTTH